MLRADGLATDTAVDLSLVADLLTRFVAAATDSSDDLPAVRRELVAATDEATMIDTAATVAAFEMMTRIANGTGTAHPSVLRAGAGRL